MPPLLDLVALRSVVAIAEAGSFTAAAHTLGLSQPAISQHVRGLESRFGVPLVARDGRASRFTAAGERVLSEARRLLAAHDETVRLLEGLEEAPLVVASTEHAVSSVLRAVLAGLESATPERRVVVRVESADTIVDGLRRGSIDLGILLGHNWDAPGDEVGRFRLRWFSSHPPALAEAATGVPLVVNHEPCRIRNLALTVLAEADRRTWIAAESSTLDGVLAAARAGLGTALLPSPDRAPSDLHERHDLPAAGSIAVRLVARRGLDDAVHIAARTAAISSFASAPAALTA